MKNMKKKVIGVGLSMAMASALCVPAMAFADSAPTNTEIHITAEATAVDVTVPTQADFVFKADGTNTYPTDFTITNNSSAQLALVKAEFAQPSTWKLQAVGYDFTNTKDARELSLKVGKTDDLKNVAKVDDTTWKADFGSLIIPKANADDDSDTLTLGFEADRGYFATAIGAEKALDMKLHFELPTV